MQDMIKMANDEKIKFNETEYNRSKSLIMLQIKALIARDLYDMSEYFQIINDDNNSLKEAMRIINNEKEYNRILRK
jgi:carboxyl-terminal processing protease